MWWQYTGNSFLIVSSLNFLSGFVIVVKRQVRNLSSMSRQVLITPLMRWWLCLLYTRTTHWTETTTTG